MNDSLVSKILKKKSECVNNGIKKPVLIIAESAYMMLLSEMFGQKQGLLGVFYGMRVVLNVNYIHCRFEIVEDIDVFHG